MKAKVKLILGTGGSCWMSNLSSTLWGAFNKLFLCIKENLKSILLPLLYIKFSSSWVLLFKAKEVFVRLTKNYKCCFLLSVYIDGPAFWLLTSPPIPRSNMLSWHQNGIFMVFGATFVRGGFFLLIFVSGKVSSSSSCRRSNSRNNIGSFQMLFSSLFPLANWQLDFFYNFLLASPMVWW